MIMIFGTLLKNDDISWRFFHCFKIFMFLGCCRHFSHLTKSRIFKHLNLRKKADRDFGDTFL